MAKLAPNATFNQMTVLNVIWITNLNVLSFTAYKTIVCQVCQRKVVQIHSFWKKK